MWAVETLPPGGRRKASQVLRMEWEVPARPHSLHDPRGTLGCPGPVSRPLWLPECSPTPLRGQGSHTRKEQAQSPPHPPGLESGLVCPPSRVRPDGHGDGGWVSCMAALGGIPGGVNLTPSGKVLGLKIVCWDDQRKGQRLVLGGCNSLPPWVSVSLL